MIVALALISASRTIGNVDGLAICASKLLMLSAKLGASVIATGSSTIASGRVLISTAPAAIARLTSACLVIVDICNTPFKFLQRCSVRTLVSEFPKEQPLLEIAVILVVLSKRDK
jgi:hypothetical protein